MEINYTCSLGNLCHAAALLKANNIKVTSYPFDWIFSGHDIIIHCIKDRFKTFLDKTYYISITDNKCGHTFYDNNMFNHYNPLTNEDDYNYYVRCVNRFKLLLKNKEPKLFVMIITNIKEENEIEMNEIYKKNIIEFNKNLSKYTTNYTLLMIFHLPNKKKQNHILTCVDNIHFLELHTLSSSDGVTFANNDDNTYLNVILKNMYKFNLKNV